MNDNYPTPQWLKTIFEGWYDPCTLSKGELRMFDGLGDFKHRTFINPPYSKPAPWVEKAISESKKGKTIVMLLPVDTSTKWYAKLIEAKANIFWFNGRMRFTKNPPPLCELLSRV